VVVTSRYRLIPAIPREKPTWLILGLFLMLLARVPKRRVDTVSGRL
jgi:hypothetical protein